MMKTGYVTHSEFERGRFQYLIEHRFHQLCQSIRPDQKPWQQFCSYANLISSHRFFSFGYRSSRNVNLPNRSGGYLPPDLQQFRGSILTALGRVLLIVIVLEVCLGGGGRLFDTGTVSPRMVLFGLGLPASKLIDPYIPKCPLIA